MQFGVNGWVWTSPVNTQAFEELAPKVKQMGFDLFEFGIESTSDLDYARGAQIAEDNGLAVSVCAAMGPDRDLIHEDAGIRRNGMEYVAHCIDAATDARREERRRAALQRGRADLAADRGRTPARHRPARRSAEEAVAAQASDKGVTLLRRAAQSLRDQLHEPVVAGD